MFSLENRRAVVTGASGGIGAATSVALTQAGAFVTATGRKKDALIALTERIGTGKCVAVEADLGEEGGPEQVLSAAEAHGGTDILVCNAGITKDQLAMRMKPEDFDKVLHVNLRQTFMLIRLFLKPMMKRRYGRIIIVTSVVGHSGNPGQANYCAAKAGLTGMAKSLALETASRGITVNCVAPGFVRTPMTDALNDAQKEQILQNIPIGSIGDPEDIAAAIVYLSSQEAKYVTGTTLHINGGMYTG